MTAPNLRKRYHLTQLECMVDGDELVLIDSNEDGSERMVLLRLNAPAAERLVSELAQGVNMINKKWR